MSTSNGCVAVPLGASVRWRYASTRSALKGCNRFVEREPLYRVHQCVFGVLAMESEPVDPRL